MIESTYLQLGTQLLEPIAAVFSGSAAALLELFNVSLGILVYILVYWPLSILVKYGYAILLEIVTIAPVPKNGSGGLALFSVAKPSSDDAQAGMLYESAQIATNYMEPIGFLVIFIGIGFVLFFRVFDVVIGFDFNAEKAQKRLLIAPVLILLWIPLANIILAMASGMTEIFSSVDVSADIASDSDTSSLDFNGIVDSFDPGTGFDAFTESEIIPLILGSVFLGASATTFFIAILAAYIRLFALYMLYAVGPFAIAMWAFAWKRISSLGAAYIKYFILLALFPVPAALISKVAPIFVLTLETVVTNSVDPDSISSTTTAEASDGTGVSLNVSEAIGLDKVARSYGLVLLPTAVGFGPWVFVIGLGNAMTVAAGTAALGTAAATGGGALIASKGVGAAKGAAKKGAGAAKGAAKKGVKKSVKDGVGSFRDKAGNIEGKAVAKGVGSKAMSAGGRVADFGSVAYDHREEIAEEVANSKMLASTGAFGTAVQGAAGTYTSGADMRNKAKDKAGTAREEAQEKRDKKNTLGENYSVTERFSGDGSLLSREGIRNRLAAGDANTLRETYRDKESRPDGSLQSDEGAVGSMGYSSDLGGELEESYAANNFNDEQLKRQLARENNNLASDWQNIDDDELDNNRMEAFRGFTEHIEGKAEDRGISATEFMQQVYGDRVVSDFEKATNPDYPDLKKFATDDMDINETAFNANGELEEVREKYEEDGYGYIAERAQRDGMANYGIDDREVKRARNLRQDLKNNTENVNEDELEEIVSMFGDELAYSADKDTIAQAIENSDISVDDAENVATAINKTTNDYDNSDVANLKDVINGQTGEVEQTETISEHNKKTVGSAVTADGINPDVDDEVQREINEQLESTLRDSAQEAMESSAETVTADDIQTNKDLFEFDKLVDEFLDGSIEGVDSVNDLDSTTEDEVRDFMQDRMQLVTDELVSDNIPEKSQMVNETVDRINKDGPEDAIENAIKDTLTNTAQEAVDKGMDFSDMEIEAREELLDVGASEKIANNIESVAEDMSYELQNKLMDETGKAMEDISTGDVVQVADRDEEVRNMVKNVRDDMVSSTSE